MFIDYEVLANDLAKAADLRSVQYAPLVNSSDIQAFEAYASAQVNNSLYGDTSKLLSTRPKNCNSSSCGWIVSDGMFTMRNNQKVPADEPIPGDFYPNAHFPLWQAAPLEPFAGAIMYDVRSDDVRKTAIGKVLSTKEPVLTDFIKLIVDHGVKPSAAMYGPITSEEKGEPIIGLSVTVFSFDDIFRNMDLVGSKDLDCVVSSSTTSYTFTFKDNDVLIRGIGDLHDPVFSKYGKKLTIPSSYGYDIYLYPTSIFFGFYVSNSPKVVAGVLVVLILFLTILFSVYMVVEYRFEHRLMEAVQNESIASRDAQIRNKKIYVRYISHEVCYLWCWLIR